MRLSRRGLILGGSALLAGCSSAASTTNLQLAGAAPASLPVLPIPAATPQPVAATRVSGPVIDPHGVVRKDLMEQLERVGARDLTQDDLLWTLLARH